MQKTWKQRQVLSRASKQREVNLGLDGPNIPSSSTENTHKLSYASSVTTKKVKTTTTVTSRNLLRAVESESDRPNAISIH